MRWKIIVVNTGIVLTVGLLAYVLLSASLADVLADPAARKTEVARALRAANARVGFDALRTEAWLRRQAGLEEVRGLYAAGTVDARQEASTAQANRVRDAAVNESEFAKLTPSLVLFVDSMGVALGRNGSALMRGDQMLRAYPSLGKALKEGESGSAIWLNRQRQEQLLVSFAPVHDAEDKVVGALVLGTPLSDDWLTRISELTSGVPLLFGTVADGKLDLVAHGEGGRDQLMRVASSPAGQECAQNAARAGRVAVADGLTTGHVIGAVPAAGYGDGTGSVLVAAMPLAAVASVASLLWPVLGVTALGVLLVVVAGWLLGNYFAQPVSELEDGLLAVINGNSQLRFQIEHPDLGGLVFRINSLLNALTGVPEDTTDEQGKPSRPPTARDFQEALSVDESSVADQVVDPGTVAALAAEPADQYYRRLYREYISAKQRIGDPIDHITPDAFVTRIRASEQEMAHKHGRAVRYQVQLRDGGIVLIAVPLNT